MIDNSSRLLMSESLKGMIPELEEEQTRAFSDAFVVTTLELNTPKESNLIVGSLDGISFDNSSEIKLDIRVEVKEAYEAFKKYTTAGLSSRLLYLHLGDNEICLEGPFKVNNFKIMSFDHQNRMCTLGVDLIRQDTDI
jgi:hypothetical protein